MSINAIIGLIESGLAKNLPTLLLQGGQFSDKLSIGQVIQGRVLQHIEGNQYMMDFSGSKQRVDSQSPLTQGQLIQARVTALNDKVELQRLASQPQTTNASAKSISHANIAAAFGREGQILQQLFEKYNSKLSLKRARQLVTNMRKTSKPHEMALAGLLVEKMQLPTDDKTLSALCQLIENQKVTPLASVTQKPLPIEQQQLTQCLKEHSAQPSTLALLLLNSQTQGPSSHQLMHFSVEEDKISPVYLALFSQDNPQTKDTLLTTQRIIIDWDSPHFGLLTIDAHLVNKHIDINGYVESMHIIKRLQEHNKALSKQVSQLELTLGQVHYTLRDNQQTSALSSIINYYIQQDSINQLI